MRLFQNISSTEAHEIEKFSIWILDVGEGRLNRRNDGVADIDISEELLITEVDNPIESIVREVYIREFIRHRERSFIFPKSSEERMYLSSDSLDPSDKQNKDNPTYIQDYLNSVRISGVPNHALRLKIGCLVMLLHNIDAHRGLMNDHVFQARILTDTRVGKLVMLPRMVLTPLDLRLPFKMRRRQFPISVAFAMTINKSQGQSLSKVVIYLPRTVFSHGQLYLAMSRLSSKSSLKILITYAKGKPKTKTRNVVFKEVFQNL
ncbi:hypothetical protein CARUB_v10007570mg [Capsella rubella]|uniref:DNA helicase Pif1-like 2B domain-containing protein n=1 Tax=Capsella rubella TaxID=81985 RepID=R0GPZ5_9BRAS|nr:hypothetical protein CARUB_v10007570mg [Capsella rubella]